jgi:hypothetical protein
MNDINKQFEIVNEILDRIDAKQKEINGKLDEVIAALHAYDDENIEDINEGYGESSFEAFQDTKNDILSWDVDGAERRMDIIGQNGNEGLHYHSHHVTNEEADEDANNKMRVGKDKNSNNTQDNKRVGEKKRTAKDRRKYYKPKNKG